MHLKNRPTYFTKDGIRKPVYYTVDARQLVEDGWVEEGVVEMKAPAKVEATPVIAATPEAASVVRYFVESEITAEPETEVDLGGMTRAELVQFAEANDVEFKSYGSKAEILEACTKAVRARNVDGTFASDDPATPDVDEAWVSTNG